METSWRKNFLPSCNVSIGVLDFSTNASGRKGPLDAVDVDPSSIWSKRRSQRYTAVGRRLKWTGFSFGYEGNVDGEIVFNTEWLDTQSL